jgi:hypothetical protein
MSRVKAGKDYTPNGGLEQSGLLADRIVYSVPTDKSEPCQSSSLAKFVVVHRACEVTEDQLLPL